jgi:(2Fe-2S) ferredoxin
MRPAPVVPSVHVFVCVNRRDGTSPLGAGCGAAGDAVYDAMKDEVARHGAVRAVWVTRAQCLGVCPKHGCTVAIYPNQRIVADVATADVPALFASATHPTSATDGAKDRAPR